MPLAPSIWVVEQLGLLALQLTQLRSQTVQLRQMACLDPKAPHLMLVHPLVQSLLQQQSLSVEFSTALCLLIPVGIVSCSVPLVPISHSSVALLPLLCWSSEGSDSLFALLGLAPLLSLKNLTSRSRLEISSPFLLPNRYHRVFQSLLFLLSRVRRGTLCPMPNGHQCHLARAYLHCGGKHQCSGIN